MGVIGAPVLQGTPLAALLPITAHGRFEAEGRDLALPGP
jgi:hypothetical protein